MPFVSPVTLTGELAAVPILPPGVLVAVYSVIGEPPLFAGGVKTTSTLVSPAIGTPMVGAPGKVKSVTGAEGAEAGPVPTAFLAVTVN